MGAVVVDGVDLATSDTLPSTWRSSRVLLGRRLTKANVTLPSAVRKTMAAGIRLNRLLISRVKDTYLPRGVSVPIEVHGSEEEAARVASAETLGIKLHPLPRCRDFRVGELEQDAHFFRAVQEILLRARIGVVRLKV